MTPAHKVKLAALFAAGLQCSREAFLSNSYIEPNRDADGKLGQNAGRD